MKRKERRQLKQDEFVSTISKVANFVKKRTRELIALIAVVLLAVIIVIISQLVKAQNAKKGSRIVAEINKIHSQLDDNPEKVAELEKIAGSRNYSRLGNIYLSTYWVEKGEYEKAEEVLSRLEKGKKDLLYYQAQELLAQIQMKKGNYDKAIEIYSRIEKEKPKKYILDGMLFHHAEAHEKKGEREAALALYKRIQNEYPQTSFGYDAAQKVRELEEKK